MLERVQDVGNPMIDVLLPHLSSHNFNDLYPYVTILLVRYIYTF